MTDEYAQAEADHHAQRYATARRVTGQDVPREPTSAELARRFVEAALDAANSHPHIDMPNDVAKAALGLISGRLACAAEENHWMRGWLARETESLNRQLTQIEAKT